MTKVQEDIQDRNCEAWKKLCEVIDRIAEEGKDEFSPLEELGSELFAQIYTLPESIAKLKKVKKLWLYRSNLVRIPPEIGEMESLEYFDPYTSYNLRWFPYEITHCKNLKDSRVSTRAIFGNFKNRMPFPNLNDNPLRYFGNTVKCSVCKKEMNYAETNQLWISLWVGTDTLPLLANLCSKECEAKIPIPSKKYVQFPHKGGLELIQPKDDDYAHWTEEYSDNIFDLVGEFHQWQEKMKDNKDKESENEEKTSLKLDSSLIQKLPLLKLIRKIWEK